MSHPYRPLTPGANIRLLQLLPAKDPTAPIQAHLVHYSLDEAECSTHLYEALSYVWGSSLDGRTILLDDHEFGVTENLFAALSRLRNHQLARLLWVDAICINQHNNTEKETQIQLMAQVFGCAIRVNVWLGDGTESSGEALQRLRLAAAGSASEVSEASMAAIRALLQRPWFRRIWVLQELGLARAVHVICGAEELNGHAFADGLAQLDMLHQDTSGLRTMISPVTHLIRGAISRPMYGTAVMEGKLPFTALIDMSHGREATIRHDRVYALLGMSTNDAGAAGLLPDYSLSWKELFHRLARCVLGDILTFDTRDGNSMALIQTLGVVFGFVRRVGTSTKGYDTQVVEIALNRMATSSYHTQRLLCELPLSTKAVQVGDIVCKLEKTSSLTILRRVKYSFSVILTGLHGSIKDTSGRQVDIQTIEARLVGGHMRRNLPLVWGLDASEEPEVSVDASVDGANDLLAESESAGEKARAFYMSARAYIDAFHDHHDVFYKQAIRAFKQAIRMYQESFGEDHPETLSAIEELGTIYKRERKWELAIETFRPVLLTRKHTQGVDHPHTLKSLGHLISIYVRKSESLEDTMRHIELRRPWFDRHISATLRDDRQSSRMRVLDEICLLESHTSPEMLIDLLLVAAADQDVPTSHLLRFHPQKKTQEMADSLQTRLTGYIQDQVVQYMKLNVLPPDPVIYVTLNRLSNAFYYLELFISHYGNRFPVTNDVLQYIAGNPVQSHTMMLRLLALVESRGTVLPVSEETIYRASLNDPEVIATLIDKLGMENLPVPDKALAAAARRWDKKHLAMLKGLISGRPRNWEVPEAVVVAAARNQFMSLELMQFLFEREGPSLPIPDDALVPVSIPESWDPVALFTLILSLKGYIRLTWELVSGVSRMKAGDDVKVLLLSQRDASSIPGDCIELVLAEWGKNREAMKALFDRREGLSISHSMTKRIEEIWSRLTPGTDS